MGGMDAAARCSGVVGVVSLFSGGGGTRQLFSIGPAACSKRFAGGGMTRKELRFLSMLGPLLIPPGLWSAKVCGRGKRKKMIDESPTVGARSSGGSGARTVSSPSWGDERFPRAHLLRRRRDGSLRDGVERARPSLLQLPVKGFGPELGLQSL